MQYFKDNPLFRATNITTTNNLSVARMVLPTTKNIVAGKTQPAVVQSSWLEIGVCLENLYPFLFSLIKGVLLTFCVFLIFFRTLAVNSVSFFPFFSGHFCREVGWTVSSGWQGPTEGRRSSSSSLRHRWHSTKSVTLSVCLSVCPSLAAPASLSVCLCFSVSFFSSCDR